MIGEHRFWAANGTMFTGSFVEGERDGLWQWLRPDGSLQGSAEYKLGKLNGEHVLFGDDGQELSRGSWRDDKKHGRWRVIGPNGELVVAESGLFEDGVKVGD